MQLGLFDLVSLQKLWRHKAAISHEHLVQLDLEHAIIWGVLHRLHHCVTRSGFGPRLLLVPGLLLLKRKLILVLGLLLKHLLLGNNLSRDSNALGRQTLGTDHQVEDAPNIRLLRPHLIASRNLGELEKIRAEGFALHQALEASGNNLGVTNNRWVTIKHPIEIGHARNERDYEVILEVGNNALERSNGRVVLEGCTLSSPVMDAIAAHPHEHIRDSSLFLGQREGLILHKLDLVEAAINRLEANGISHVVHFASLDRPNLACSLLDWRLVRVDAARVNNHLWARAQGHVVVFGPLTGIDAILGVKHHLRDANTPRTQRLDLIGDDVDRDAIRMQLGRANGNDLVPAGPNDHHRLVLKHVIGDVVSLILQVAPTDPAVANQNLIASLVAIAGVLAVGEINLLLPPLRRIVAITSSQNLINGSGIKPRLLAQLAELHSTHH